MHGFGEDQWQLAFYRWTRDGNSPPAPKIINLDALTPADADVSSTQLKPHVTTAYQALQAQEPATSSAASAKRTMLPLPVDVSRDLGTIAWAWGSKLHLLAGTGSQQSVPFQLPLGAQANGVHLIGASEVLLQDTGSGITYYDLKRARGAGERLAQSVSLRTPCALAVSGHFALIGCPESELVLWDFSESPPKAAKLGNWRSSFSALALTPSGSLAAATDQGEVLAWSQATGWKRLQSPGVAQVLAYDGRVVVAGGGFRGVFLLAPDKPATPIVEDVTGATLLSIGKFDFNSNGDVATGRLALATREGATSIEVRSSRSPNGLGIKIAGSLLLFWVLNLVVIPGVRLWSDEIRRRREVRLRRELELTLERVPRSTNDASAPSSVALPDPPEELIKACSAGDCVAFIGAGMSAQAGLPTWRSLIQGILSEVSKRGSLPPEQCQSLQEALEAGQADLVADEIVSATRAQQEVISGFLSRTFLRSDVRITRAQNLLRSLNLSAVLTTNFDNLLEQTFTGERVYTHQDSDKLLEALLKHQFFVLKLYGSLDLPDSVLLAPFQYFEAMARNLLFSRFMDSLFSSRTLFFVGASLEGIEAYLTGIKFPTAKSQKHFALVPAPGTAWRAKAVVLSRRFGIQVLAFTPTEGYPEIEQFLQKLATSVRSKGVEVRTRKIARLKQVTLDNIGPFDHLDLTLDPKWNILLGDNGVGKSTILRAIAVGIAGADAAEFAGSLLKAGKEKEGGKITLKTDDGTVYVTEIRRGDKTIVESSPSRPLEPERWLALGFPPLRSFSRTPVTELPPRGLQRLTSEDLMPLIRGDTDPRLDKLKAWIVDLDYRDAQRRASNKGLWSFLRGGSSTQFSHLRDQFFEIIRRLTPGLRLGRVEIDADKKQVRIETDDGILPIELVSQGTQSLLGWVGILLQRLDGIYGEAVDNRQGAGTVPGSLLDQFALVLMDEIDAHMHPKWQQIIVSKLKDLLPNCQIIATTHSPLIVVGMERDEVLLFRREGEGDGPKSKVLVERPKGSLRGWSVDQILTGLLFGLETVLDPTIHEDVERYTELAAKDSRNETEENQLKELAAKLKITRPEPKQREEARLAFGMIEKALEQQMEQIPESKRKKVWNEVKVQIEENITNSRRPE